MNKSLKIKPSKFLSQVVVDDEHKKFPELFKKEMEKVFSSTISIDLSKSLYKTKNIEFEFSFIDSMPSFGLKEYRDNNGILGKTIEIITYRYHDISKINRLNNLFFNEICKENLTYRKCKPIPGELFLEYVVVLQPEFIAKKLAKIILKEEIDLNEKLKQTLKRIDINKYETDVRELFVNGLSSPNILVEVDNKSKEFIVRKPNEIISYIIIKVESIDLSYNSNDINEELMKFSKYNNTISIGLYLDNSIIIHGFFNYSKKVTTLNITKFKTIEKIEELIQVINNLAKNLYKMESDLSKVNALEYLTWKQNWYNEVSKLLYKEININGE